MYDIASKSINKLNGELSTKFVNVAEENAKTHDIDKSTISETGVLEKISDHHHMNEDDDDDDNNDDDYTNSDNLTTEIVTTISGSDDTKNAISQNKYDTKILISSGYSVIKS